MKKRKIVKKKISRVQKGLVKGVDTVKTVEEAYAPLLPSPLEIGRRPRRPLSVFDTIEGTAEERFMRKEGKWKPDAEDRFWLN